MFAGTFLSPAVFIVNQKPLSFIKTYLALLKVNLAGLKQEKSRLPFG